jgi:hypothetical protein
MIASKRPFATCAKLTLMSREPGRRTTRDAMSLDKFVTATRRFVRLINS